MQTLVQRNEDERSEMGRCGEDGIRDLGSETLPGKARVSSSP